MNQAKSQMSNLLLHSHWAVPFFTQTYTFSQPSSGRYSKAHSRIWIDHHIFRFKIRKLYYHLKVVQLNSNQIVDIYLQQSFVSFAVLWICQSCVPNNFSGIILLLWRIGSFMIMTKSGTFIISCCPRFFKESLCRWTWLLYYKEGPLPTLLMTSTPPQNPCTPPVRKKIIKWLIKMFQRSAIWNPR